MAIFNLAVKLALAISVGIALPLMQALGFNPAAVGPGRPWALLFVGLILPTVFWIAAFGLLWSYPLDRRRHRVVQRWLARRSNAGAVLSSAYNSGCTE
jgi:Na+/melibiose symporter-like transporter